MLKRKRHPNRYKKENKNERVILDLPLKQKKKHNITKEKNVKERRKKEINNTSIHNNEEENDNSENINDNQNMESQFNIKGNNINNKRAKKCSKFNKKNYSKYINDTK